MRSPLLGRPIGDLHSVAYAIYLTGPIDFRHNGAMTKTLFALIFTMFLGACELVIPEQAADTDVARAAKSGLPNETVCEYLEFFDARSPDRDEVIDGIKYSFHQRKVFVWSETRTNLFTGDLDAGDCVATFEDPRGYIRGFKWKKDGQL